METNPSQKQSRLDMKIGYKEEIKEVLVLQLRISAINVNSY